MLVLTRKVGERFRIGQDIEVTIVRLAGDRVRVGVTAPSETPIRRIDPAAGEVRSYLKRRA